MTKRFLTIVSPLLIVIAAVVGCTKSDNGKFTISIDPAIEEVIDTQPLTKALTSEQIETFTVAVEGTEIKGPYSELSGKEFTLPAGNYVATAESISVNDAEAGYGKTRYSGSQSFGITSLAKTQVITISCSVANCAVSAVLEESFKGVFDEGSTTVIVAEDASFSTRALDILSGTTTNTAWYSAGKSLSVRVSTKKTGATEQISYQTASFVSEPGKSYTLTISKSDTTTGGLTLKVDSSDVTTGDFLSMKSFVLTEIKEDN
ncbi:MAG: DUF4493 domain-containing protein [Candidatus Cryptobacteroides sp.]